MRTLAAFVCLCLAGRAQHQHATSAPGEKPVALLPGLGIWTHRIATRNPQVQKFFDQGLVMLYGFNRPEALRSFRKVLELDPHAAIAQWFESLKAQGKADAAAWVDREFQAAWRGADMQLRLKDL